MSRIGVVLVLASLVSCSDKTESTPDSGLDGRVGDLKTEDRSSADTTLGDLLTERGRPPADTRPPTDLLLRDWGPPVVGWPFVGGGQYQDYAGAVAVDKGGNIYVAGHFGGRVTSSSFGNGGAARLGKTTLISKGEADLFVAKFDSTGQVVWAVSAGSKYEDSVSSLKLDGSGGIYIAGYFGYGTRGPETATFGKLSVTSKGDGDIFVAKLDAKGTFVWVTVGGGTYGDRVNGLAVDSAGALRIAGTFGNGAGSSSTSASFGSTVLKTKGASDAFVAQLDAKGAFAWTVSGGSTDFDWGEGVGVDNSGNAYVVGSFGRSATFGTLAAMSTGRHDVFVAKLDKTGKFVWVTSAGGDSGDYGLDIAVDGSGNSHVTGYFQKSTKGSSTFGKTVLTSNGGSDLFVAKLDASGTFTWATGVGGSLTDLGMGIALDSAGNALVTGRLWSAVTFGTSTPKHRGAEDVFLGKLDKTGKPLWAVLAGGSGSDVGIGVATDTSDNVYVSGGYGHDTFGSPPATFGTVVRSTRGSYDLFVARMSSGGTFF